MTLSAKSIASTLSILAMLCIMALGLLRCQPEPVHAFDPAVYDLTVQAGEDFAVEASFLDSAGRTQNLTGYSYQAQARPDYASPAFAIFSTSTANNRVTLRLNRTTTAQLSGKRGVWDLQQTDPSGQKTYWLRGKIIVVPVVTR